MYAYCLNNPVNHIDSSGAFPWLIVFVAVCVIGGAIYGATTNRNLSDELRIQNETPRAPISQFTQPITQQSSNRVLPPYQVDTIPLPEQVVPSTANNSSAGVSKPNTFSAQKASEPLSAGDRICNAMIGASVGCMAAGAVLILGGAAACMAGSASVVVPIFGVTGQQTVAWGILSYNVFPVFTAPFLGMETEVLEYPS